MLRNDLLFGLVQASNKKLTVFGACNLIRAFVASIQAVDSFASIGCDIVSVDGKSFSSVMISNALVKKVFMYNHLHTYYMQFKNICDN